MSKAAELCERVKHILMQDWDPIGVRDVPKAQDEYDSYVSPIAAMLATDISVSELSKHLLDIETKKMGLAGNRARAVVAAKRLCELPKG